MSILDEAIKEHLDLKRRRGTDEPEIKRLEDEAFGPPGRPAASGAADAAIASALASPGTDTAVEERPAPSKAPEVQAPEVQAAASEAIVSDKDPVSETAPVPDGPAPEEPPAPAPEKAPDEGTGEAPDEGTGEAPAESAPPASASADAGDGIAFHDLAAEEGLVGASSDALDDPFVDEPAVESPVAEESPAAERPAADVSVAEPPSAERTEEAPLPHSEDTQVHDMAKELELGADDEPAAPEAMTADEALGEVELEELDLELEDDELELPPVGEDEPASPNGSAEPPEPEGSVEVAESEASAEVVESEELEIVEPEIVEPEGEAPDDGEDVLEETPEFLRDVPESDRLWFEQGKPKDFDFDEE